MKYENWIRLLNYWQGVKLRHALSFSFIIGAIKEFSGNEVETTGDIKEIIKNLIDEIRSHKGNGYYHHIYRCPDIGVLVITKVNSDSAPTYSTPIENTNKEVSPSLYVTDGIVKDSQSPIDELIESIFKESGNAIETGNYSRNGGHFGVLSEYDKKAIEKAFA